MGRVQAVRLARTLYFASAFAVAMNFSVALAQDSSPPGGAERQKPLAWFTGGVGWGGWWNNWERNGDESGPSWVLSVIGTVRQGQAITGRLARIHEFGPFFGSGDSDRWTDIGVMYGFLRRGRRTIVSGAAGIGAMGFDKRDSSTTYLRGSIPLDLQITFAPWRSVGFGFQGIGDLNTKEPAIAGFLCLQFGRLKSPRKSGQEK